MGFETDVPSKLLEATADLWRLTRTERYYGQPEFQALHDVCKEAYSVEGGNLALGSPLGDVLRACGYNLPPKKRALALPPEEAAQVIHRAFVARTSKRIHLCPLDWADRDMPRIKFGRSLVGQFATEELMALADAGRLARTYGNVDVDWSRLAQLHWLIVEETVTIEQSPAERSMPFLFLPTKRDLGAFNPHRGRFPTVVEEAIFLLLLAPWEEWAESVEVDWRGFRIPWVFTSDSDLFARSTARPPDADTLTFQPHFFAAGDGQEEEVELPASFHLKEGLQGLAEIVNEGLWERYVQASGGPLFQVPIQHFFVRGFQTDDIDEFLAHMLTIEAALGLREDFGKGAKARMLRRVSTLLGDPAGGEEYGRLFEVRSQYVHGRPMEEIGSGDMARARGLARRVVLGLIEAAVGGGGAGSRAAFLNSMLTR